MLKRGHELRGPTISKAGAADQSRQSSAQQALFLRWLRLAGCCAGRESNGLL